ncbi:MAG: DUF1553 domain-containing protein [Candidatus Solibacter usitatus]|nr:DUF1553 domain-containing protein [Candidatus Solibacter usitatus]
MIRLFRATTAITLFVTVHGVRAAPKVNFQREVRPILSDACFQCHGPDKTSRMAGLRLDLKDAALAVRKTGAVVLPGDSKKSLLYQRVSAAVEAKRMPPPYSHKKLTEQQKETLKRWIDEGANWQEHWSFIAPVRPPAPEVKDARWVRNPIDRFVLARLEARGLAPAPEADRRTLARRLSLDLTGLPPRPEEVETFVKDGSPEAYERLADRLLASPRWGEHRARYWLDAARYGDTHGIHVDNYREMWPYRDWVIGAFNANMAFDRFTIEQLAGDLLPASTLEQKIASGFQRCNVTTNEAGVIIDEVEAIYAKDRADTTGAVWMGLTVGCATCHDHKFDPIGQRDFYSLTAFFRNTTQHAMDGNISDTPPIVVVPNRNDRARWDAIAAEEKSLRAELLRVQASVAPAGAVGRLPGETFSLLLDGSIRVVTAIGAEPLAFPKNAALGGSPWPDRMALHLGRESSLEAPAGAALDTRRAATISAWFYYPLGEEYYSIAAQTEQVAPPVDQKADKKDAKPVTRGWTFFVSARVPGARFYSDNGKSVEVRAGHLDQVIPGTWNHVAFSYDGSGEALGVRFFMNGAEVKTQRDARATLAGSIAAAAPIKFGNPSRPDAGAIADFRVFSTLLSEQEIALLAPGSAGALARFAALQSDGSYQRAAARLRELDLEKRDIRRRGAVTFVMEERGDQKPFANVLYRGMYDQKRARVEPGTPLALPPMTASMPRNRLGLAMWIVDPGNPLTARVTVNRFWQEIFGAGLVKTAEDFGSQGEAPVNQELLDWLAVEFREGGWDVKKFFRMLVTSSAYRQAAVATAEKLEKDPENRLLSRGPRFRMDGEMVRDAALESGGLLGAEIGGPSVKPYQPDGVWEAVAMLGSDTRFYKRDTVDKLYRRSMYTFWKRSAPPASMEIFNAPTRESCTVRRERTNTPLQALVTMNDPQFVEAARVLAARAMEWSKGDLDGQVDYMARRLVSRPLSDRERSVVQAAYRDFLRFYDTKPEEAGNLLATGEWKADATLPRAELAALTMVANQLMNLDEVLAK